MGHPVYQRCTLCDVASVDTFLLFKNAIVGFLRYCTYAIVKYDFGRGHIVDLRTEEAKCAVLQQIMECKMETNTIR